MADRLQRAGTLLLRKRSSPEDFFPGLSPKAPTTLRDANKFFLGAILNFGIRADLAWENARRFAEEIVPDAERLWQFIAGVTPKSWESKFSGYKLHRFRWAHMRVRRIAKDILHCYAGDPRRIWEGQSPNEVANRLDALRVGPQISRMILGALMNVGKVDGQGDVKVDIHVRRVLGRVVRGKEYAPSEEGQVLTLTRQMSPDNPWLIDEPLYTLGKTLCRPSSPQCSQCYLGTVCEFFRAQSLER